jgi:guanylate cyclase
MTRLGSALLRIGADPTDEPDLALQKQILVTVSTLVALAGVAWALVYIAFGEVAAGAIPLTYSLLSGASISLFAATGVYPLFGLSKLNLILALHFALLAQLLQSDLTVGNSLPDWLIGLFFVSNVGGVAAVVFITVYYFVGQKDAAMSLLAAEQDRSERLLLNILPREIAAQLKDGERTIAQHYDAVSVLFADIVGFTSLTVELAPDELIESLNEVFLFFDDVVERHGCEKIRTIGDNYMAAAGVPTPRPDHAHALAAMALEMRNYSERSNGFSFRIGIDSGPIVAGVIGRSRFQYDIWGDAVNTASRMESHGVPDRIQLTRTTYNLIKDDFECSRRGLVEVKGKEPMETWFLEGHRNR